MSCSGLKKGGGGLILIVKVQHSSSVDPVETMLRAVISVWNLWESESMNRYNVNERDK